MTSDRSWIGRSRFNAWKNIFEDYKKGVASFIEYARAHVKDNFGLIRSPYKNCGNQHLKGYDEVTFDLYRYGIIEWYTKWNLPGEKDVAHVDAGTSSSNIGQRDVDMYDARDMLRDIVEANIHSENFEEEPNATTKDFYKMLDSASEPIYPNNTNFTALSFVNELLHFKNKHNCSNNGFDDWLKIIASVLPPGHKLPLTYYEVRKMIKGLHMKYEKIEACKNDCMLFYKKNSGKTHCDVCKESRYKEQKDPKKKKIPKKILRYFPLTERLQHLYMNESTAECMKWHHNRVIVDGQLCHPADGDEWKQFDRRFPNFAKEIQNVRLGLSADRFDPFRDAYAKEYTVWPVVVVVYNLPSSMCTTAPYMFMSLLIPGPNDPTNDLHVYLRPLVDELKTLWRTGEETYDRSSCTNFVMKVALMWTISNFLALSMLSGCSTKGKLSCLVCIGGVKAKHLKHGGKPSFYGTARYFLEPDDPLRRRTKFGSRETRSVTSRHSGLIAKTRCEEIQLPPPGKSI